MPPDRACRSPFPGHLRPRSRYPMFDFVAWRRWFYILSLAIVVPGIISLALPGGLRPGIDFTSGTLIVLRFANEPEQAAVRRALAEVDHGEAVVQRANNGTYLIRTRPLRQVTDEVPADVGGTEVASERNAVLGHL